MVTIANRVHSDSHAPLTGLTRAICSCDAASSGGPRLRVWVTQTEVVVCFSGPSDVSQKSPIAFEYLDCMRSFDSCHRAMIWICWTSEFYRIDCIRPCWCGCGDGLRDSKGLIQCQRETAAEAGRVRAAVAARVVAAEAAVATRAEARPMRRARRGIRRAAAAGTTRPRGEVMLIS